MHLASLELLEVYPVEETYPEYDQLLKPLEEGGVGFKAALLPNYGDDDPLGRFERHKAMLENQLGLEGVLSANEDFVRFTWSEGPVKMIIDLYDPTMGWFTNTFHQVLGEYQLVFYNGHSNYGTQPFLTNQDAFSADYQILMMHACRTYPYYTRQVFRAKSTEDDPAGFALADVVASGRSTSPYDSPRTLRPLLEELMEGITRVHGGEPHLAPSWLSIVGKMNSLTWDKLYGVAGVRNNAWQPN